MDKLIEKIARYTHTAKPATRRSFLKLVGKATIAAGTAAGIAAVSLQTASAYDGGDGGIALEETTDTC